jgi:Flp pilus assembly pilin Flp
MAMNQTILGERGQAAIEYMLLLALVVAVVFIAVVRFLPRTYNATNGYITNTALGILGEPNRCGNGLCDRFENNSNCPPDC